MSIHVADDKKIIVKVPLGTPTFVAENFIKEKKDWIMKQMAKVENSDLYINVQDKWMERIDATYKRIFNEAQWKKYWRSGAERAQKARDKRKK